MMLFRRTLLALAIPAALAYAQPKQAPTVKEAQQFLERANDRLLELAVDFSVADWIRATYITDDTDHMAAKLNDRLMSANAQMAKEAARFNGLKLAPDTARQIKLLKLSLTAAPPADRKASAELAQLLAELEGIYGKGKYCPEDGKPCQDLGDLSRILARSRNPKELEAAWKGWHAIAKPIREHYIRFVQLSNQGAKELGFADTGAMWRSKYDMTPDAYAKEVDRLWEQVKPLYMSLHTYVRWKLREKYGDAVVPAKGPIPAHLLGNMWAQEWGALYPELAPKNADPGYDLTKILNERKVDAKQMVRYGEQFFSSLGFDPLPPTFWTRSQFVKPRDREVVCHASAWDVDFNEDIRIKMCIEINDEDFTTVHHELGHNYYQREYRKLPFLYRDSANDGFHEAIGDTVALSVTPEYLVKIGLLDKAPPQDKDIGLLLKRALDKVAFLPFGLLVDKWRWQVFSGAVPPAKYNEAWWNLRKQYQGVAPPVERTEADFDPGAKYHVPGNTPYSRYFLAAILQFQMHRGLSQIAGCKDALHRCSIYENKAAGAKLKQMLGMGASKPWPEALAVVTNGQKQMDATAIVDYFAPLKKWLDEQNQGKPTGWD